MAVLRKALIVRLKAPQALPAFALAVFILAGGWAGPADTFAVRQAVAQATASVDGFRSAQFGMTEKQVYAALKKDFRVSKENVTRTENTLEKTNSFLLAVNDIIPESGQAIVAYIFGYETKKLIQINVIWSNDGQSLASAESLVATGNILRNYFVDQGFPAEGICRYHLASFGFLTLIC